jgi:hypothetical protein
MVIVSLGSNCAVTYHLNRFGMRNQAYPFDWAKVPIKSLINVLENNFNNYTELKVKKFSYNHLIPEINLPSYIVNNNYGISFAHEIFELKSIKEYSELLKLRIDRFRSLENPTFVRIETTNLTEKQMNYYNDLIKSLDKYFIEYKLIVISKIKPNNDKIIWYPLALFDENWKYNYLNWHAIFNI